MAVWYRPEPLCIVVRNVPMPGFEGGTTTIANGKFDQLKLDLIWGLDELMGPSKIKEWEPIRNIIFNLKNMEELAYIVGLINQRFDWELELSWEDL